MSAAQHRKPRRTTARVRWTRLWRPVGIPLVFILASGAAWAYWSAGSNPGGNGAAATTMVNVGKTPIASAAGTSMTVSWAASTLENGDAVSGYTIKRYDDATKTVSDPVLAGCTGKIIAKTCTEIGVPVGDWVYSVTPVFATNWQGAESPKSNTVTSDDTKPANVISISDLAGWAYKSSDTIFYRGVIAGSFTLTNAVTHGPASSRTVALGGTSNGWTHAGSVVSSPLGGPYVSTTFAWAAGTTTSPTEVVTGTDGIGQHVDTTLTFVNDSDPPSAETITYADGYRKNGPVVVTFTTKGSDSGSGVAARHLQRSVADIAADLTCGAYSDGWVIVGADRPTSPYLDSDVIDGKCYRYRYVVTDWVGNQALATSTSVAKLDSAGYAGAVLAEPSLLSQWRLGEAPASLISSDSFSDSLGTALTSHTGEIGATWANLGGDSSSNTEKISVDKRAYRSGQGYSVNYTTATPPKDYSVEADLFVKSDLNNDTVGVLGRLDTSHSRGYFAGWQESDNDWHLARVDSGQITDLATSSNPSVAEGGTYRIRLEMIGTTLKLYVNGVLTVGPVTDPTYGAAGRAGIMDGEKSSGGGEEGEDNSPDKSGTAGIHFDNFQVTPASYPKAADSKGINHGDYFAGPTLGVPGAIAGEANTAAQFAGVNGYVRAAAHTPGIPVGSSPRSVEMWFKTTSAEQQVLFSYGTPANGREFGLWLGAGGLSMTTGIGAGNDKTFPLSRAVNDGLWHQVVQTYGAATITVYIDGKALSPQGGVTLNTVVDAYGFGIGAVIVPGDVSSGGYFNGSLDEVSLYTTALTQATITKHFQLADIAGPTGGSVDAASLVGTGARYSTSTTLTLNLNKGTDPSGVATTGARLYRSTGTTGTLANGSCVDSYNWLELPGADASSLTNTVDDQSCYRYYYTVSDRLGNFSTFWSSSIKVDTTPPAAPTLSFSGFNNTSWSGPGSTVYYRPGATSGSFTVTATATDPASGIASYAFPPASSLGAGWTSTSGVLGVKTYSWNAAPGSPSAQNVTATNNATLISAGTSFTLTPDTTAPTTGSVDYVDGATAGSGLSVAFTNGTDVGGSGVGTGLLERASATLTGSSCGSYGGWATVANPATSPYLDSVVGGKCYKYRYSTVDRVGNASTPATSTKAARVSTYLDLIKDTNGLLSYWRLGEATPSSDTFVGTDGAMLQNRNGEVGATWARHSVSQDDAIITNAGRVSKNGTQNWALYYSSGAPATADYRVGADVFVASSVANDVIGVVGRLSSGTSSGTFYAAVYDRNSQTWILYRVVSGTKNVLGVPYSDTTFTSSTTRRLTLDMTGTTIRLLVDGVERVSVVDTNISSTGKGGLTVGFGTANTTLSNTTGMQLDNFQVSPPMADSNGTNTGSYVKNGPTLGVSPGAITGDPSTATAFDGINDYSTVARSISGDFSIEFWFRSTQGIGTGGLWYQGAGMVDASTTGTSNDFGVSLRADGRVMAGVGNPDVSILSAGSLYNNGAWHHVVFTRAMAAGALNLYVDGQAMSGTTSNLGSLSAATSISFGRLQSGGNFFEGALDEVAVYGAVLTPLAVTAHYNAGR